MTNTLALTATALLFLFLGGCSRDYTPDSKASGEEIYQAACAECHEADESGMIFKISSKNANSTYIAHKVKSGSLTMPSFPNMKTEDFKKLSAFVLEHSKIE